MILMTKEKLEQSFHEAAKFFADQGVANIDDANILSGIYTKMFGLYPQIIDIDTEGAYLNKKMKDDEGRILSLIKLSDGIPCMDP